MNKNPLNLEAEEYLDKHFPKGDKRRGEAMVLFALALQDITKLYEKELGE